MAATSYIGLHWFCRISKQMLPSAYTIWVEHPRNKPNSRRLVGIIFCKLQGKLEHGNSASMADTHPKMTAFQSMMLLSCGAPLIPAGGSCCSRLKSRISRFLAGVDIPAAAARKP
ncbi:Os07g0166850 [Oryza sativa Japonica Group]|uniref:Os07g0166850 protein n=1 Tax=Oryza sativa subsp. japonica TaxID=39947 RepID=A0A0P0X2W5_ORYSJ|nr:hypothetical protein EE612_037354 [Oryza sativa]BAT00211.1 Os07g0166850 [Oryza sativa Japonica Group]